MDRMCVICSMVGAEARNQSACIPAPAWLKMNGPEKIRAILEVIQFNLLGFNGIKLVNIGSRYREYGQGLCDSETFFNLKSTHGRLSRLFTSSHKVVYLPF